MANSIALFKKYVDLLDEVYKVSAKTSVLDMDSSLVQAGANANEITIPKMSMDGLADYSRSSGYVGGDVDLTYETVKFNYYRGRKFSFDAMDNEETAGIAFGKLSSEFIRTKVVPELDAVRFATYAGVEGIGEAKENLTSGGEVVLAAVTAANNAMDEAEVDADGRYLFITPTLHNLINAVDSYKSKAMLDRFAAVIDVPQSRFYTAVALMDGKTGDEKSGGYKKADAVYEVTASQPADWSTNYKSYFTKSGNDYTAVSGGSAPSWTAGTYYKQVSAGGAAINFMIVQKSAAIQYSKHTVNKVFTPDENQDSDGWVFCYRAYGLTDAYENRAAGIYCSHE